MVKDILREIKAKWFQFIAIVTITALGVGFFAGIRVTGYDMRTTADRYMETSEALDFEYRNTLGIDQQMLDELTAIVDGNAVGVYDTDAFIGISQGDAVVHVVELNESTSRDLTLIEGRMPTQKNEVVVDSMFKERSNFQIGSKVQLKSNDIFEASDLTIVGYVQSNLYMNLERGSTTIGSGNVSGFIYAQDLDKKVDVYTSARFNLSPDADVSVQRQAVIDQEQALIKNRFDRLSAPIIEELEAAQKTLNAENETAVTEINKAKQDLATAKETLDAAYIDLNAGLNTMAQGLGTQTVTGSLQDKLDALLRITDGKVNVEIKQLTDGIAQIDANLSMIEATEAELSMGITQVETKKAEAIASLTNPDLTEAEKAAIEASIVLLDTNLAELNAQKEQLLAQKAGAIAMKQDLESKLAEANAGIDALRSSQATLQAGITQYNSGMATYENGVQTLETKTTEAAAAINDAQRKIDNGYTELESKNNGKQFVLERKDVLIGYNEFYQDSDRIEAIGQVFPLIFFGVAILVTLSTISRMIDESRSQIGVYKALGYSWIYASMKFVGFAFFSWFIGSVLGIIFGFYLIPTLIYDAYRIMYQTPPLVPEIVWSYAWQPLLVSFISSVGIAFVKAARVSREGTANLLRPPMPKAGNRMLLERVTPVWSRLSFLYKVSLRNLLRNKTRFMMTLIGIGGCAGLLITGIGIRHSIYSIVDKQFDTINKYDGLIMHDGASDFDDVSFTAKLDVTSEFVDVAGTNSQLFVVEDFEKLPEFVSMQTRRNQEPIPLQNDTVVITEKLAILEGLSIGDPFTLQQNDIDYTFTVGGITENYVLHYVYMSDETYEAVTGKAIHPNLTLFNTDADHAMLSEKILAHDNVYSVQYMDVMQETYRESMGNFDIVVYVIVGAAFALELIVLLNLITMNMSERKKELATLKVLGFYPKELSTYIMRENIILTLISVLGGIVFGFVLHRYVVLSAELDAIMFNRELQWSSIIIATLITFIISVVTNLVMSRRANDVNMSEALKTFDN